MSRRTFLRIAGTGAVSAAAVPGSRSLAVSRLNHARPNILWIYSDDHACNAVSAYGGRLASVAPTPNIDRIAKEGMLFRNSFVTNSLCGPCRAVIQTGKHSHINGFRQNGDTFNGDQQTFPKLLQRGGYQTAIIGKWHLRTEPQGYDFWQVLPGQGNYYNPDFITPDGKIQVHGYVTDIITDKAINWLKNDRDPSKPFMLMVQHKAPHREWEPGPDHLTDFDNVTIPEPDNLFDDYSGRGTAAHKQDMSIAKTMLLESDLKLWPTKDKDSSIPKSLKKIWTRTIGRLDDAQRAKWDAAYAKKNEAFRKANLTGDDLVRWKYQRFLKDYLRCIASVDDNVGRILAYLEKTGLDKNTVVFYSSDQSFYLGEHGWFDKRFIYEESLRTPMVARWPGVIQPGSETDALVQNLDCAETFLDIAGMPIPDDMQGASLVPLMKGKTPPDWRTSIYYQYYEGENHVHHVYKHYGVRTKRYKLIYFYTLDEWEFYDLQTDPHEMCSQYNNPKYADKIAELKKELKRLRKLYRMPADDESVVGVTK
ncbi:MAG: sulfatase [Candidatus Hydrogenedentes bacterium]|nr:sulfatase [Candidatus Hydrogenedentota bacterium]